MTTKSWRVVLTIVALLLALFAYTRFVAVDTRPLPQVQPTLDIARPTQPIRELEATATP